MNTWDDLNFWSSKDWMVIQDHLNIFDTKKVLYNPTRRLLFNALGKVPFDKVKVIIVGQDPYPKHELATGVAFSIPETAKTFPPTLVNLLGEYLRDIHPDHNPPHGDLSKWCDQGVLLWNAIPMCLEGKSMSLDHPEWHSLTKEIIQKLSTEGPRCNAFVFLGGVARKFAQYCSTTVGEEDFVLQLSHPSPRASAAAHSGSGFIGSRMFSTINAGLVRRGMDPIDWRL